MLGLAALVGRRCCVSRVAARSTHWIANPVPHGRVDVCWKLGHAVQVGVDARLARVFALGDQPPFSPSPVFAKASTGTPISPTTSSGTPGKKQTPSNCRCRSFFESVDQKWADTKKVRASDRGGFGYLDCSCTIVANRCSYFREVNELMPGSDLLFRHDRKPL